MQLQTLFKAFSTFANISSELKQNYKIKTNQYKVDIINETHRVKPSEIT